MPLTLTRRSLLVSAGAVIGASQALLRQQAMAQQAARRRTLIVPFAAGGAADIIGRVVGERLGARTGETVIVENRAGAGSNIGLAAVAKSAVADNVFGLASVALAVNPSLYKAKLFDPLQDFSLLTLALETPNVVIVPAASAIRSIPDLVAAAKAKPNGISYASAGVGSSLHLAAVLFCQMAGVTMTHVPYRGTNPAMADLIGGRIDVIFDNASTAVPQATSGTVRAIGVTTKARIAALPEVPTVAEQGMPDYVMANWWAFVGSPEVPAEAAAKFSEDLRSALRDDVARTSFDLISGTIMASTQDELRQHLTSEVRRWEAIVARAGIEPI